jgi:hypothetical protein
LSHSNVLLSIMNICITLLENLNKSRTSAGNVSLTKMHTCAIYISLIITSLHYEALPYFTLFFFLVLVIVVENFVIFYVIFHTAPSKVTRKLKKWRVKCFIRISR